MTYLNISTHATTTDSASKVLHITIFPAAKR